MQGRGDRLGGRPANRGPGSGFRPCTWVTGNKQGNGVSSCATPHFVVKRNRNAGSTVAFSGRRHRPGTGEGREWLWSIPIPGTVQTGVRANCNWMNQDRWNTGDEVTRPPTRPNSWQLGLRAGQVQSMTAWRSIAMLLRAAVRLRKYAST